MSDNNCPLGTECGIHYRLTARNEDEHGSLQYVDYLGRYAVITGHNPLSFLAGAPAPYDTHIVKVGDKTLYEASVEADFKYGQRADEAIVRWVQKYESFDLAKNAHDFVVAAFKAGLIEVGD